MEFIDDIVKRAAQESLSLIVFVLGWCLVECKV